MKWTFIGIGIAVSLFAIGIYDAYDNARILNENRCWGCLALDPIGKIYDGFWIEYPKDYGKGKEVPHPEWVKEELDNGSVVMLFFWYEGCYSCEVLWEKMKKEGIVEGDEAHGKIVGFENVTLFTIDTIKDERRDALSIYSKRNGSPTTVILFKEDDTIYWYAFEGSEIPKDKNGKEITVKKILEDAIMK
ncbi:MAG: hypothetical protein FE048_01025 [Thermoplasmata archaeon]|nr:MAG: hypothetical protein FE048_01025 [Thermoplasmata archaeon]